MLYHIDENNNSLELASLYYDVNLKKTTDIFNNNLSILSNEDQMFTDTEFGMVILP